MALTAVERPAEHEEKIRKTVQVLNTVRRQTLFGCECDYAPLCPPAHRARHMTKRSCPTPAGEDEFLQRRQRSVVRIERLLETGDVGRLQTIMTGNGELSSELEQDVLDAREQIDDVRAERFADEEPQLAVELVHRADSLDAQAVLRHARAVPQTGLAAVACARIDLRESVSHKALHYRVSRAGLIQSA